MIKYNPEVKHTQLKLKSTLKTTAYKQTLISTVLEMLAFYQIYLNKIYALSIPISNEWKSSVDKSVL